MIEVECSRTSLQCLRWHSRAVLATSSPGEAILVEIGSQLPHLLLVLGGQTLLVATAFSFLLQIFLYWFKELVIILMENIFKSLPKPVGIASPAAPCGS